MWSPLTNAVQSVIPEQPQVDQPRCVTFAVNIGIADRAIIMGAERRSLMPTMTACSISYMQTGKAHTACGFVHLIRRSLIMHHMLWPTP
jgi:hypothetical protein